VLGRLLSNELQQVWGQSVILDNRPGAAGLIGARQAAAAPADGLTLLMASTGAILTLAASHAGAEPYDVARDLAPVSLVAHRPTSWSPIRRCRCAARPTSSPTRSRTPASSRSDHPAPARLASLRRAVRAARRHRHPARALSRHRPAVTDLLAAAST